MTQSDAITKDNRPEKRAVLVLAAIVVALAVLNVAVTWLEPSQDWLEVLIIGGWVFEPILFGIWAALGSGSLLTRLPLVVPCLLILWITPGLAPSSFGEMERYEFITMACAGLAIFTVSMLTCLTVRCLTGRRIDASDAQTIRRSRIRFSMKYLLGTTTIWALLLGMAAQLTFRTKPPPPSFITFGPDFYVYFFFLGGAIASGVALPITAVTLFVLRPKFTKRAVQFVGGFWFVVTALAIGIFTYLEKSQTESLLDVLLESLLGVLLVQLGATAVGLLVALPMRWVGFRLIGGRPSYMQVRVSSPSVTQ